MMFQEEKTDAIVLRSQDYKERSRLVTIYTKSHGLIDLIFRSISKKNTALISLSTPFTEGEFVYKTGRRSLHSFIDGTLKSSNHELRSSYKHLNAASQILQLVKTSQLPGKPSHTLYAMLKAYLKALPTFDNPDVLLASFRLKLLSYEGFLSFSPICTHCHTHPSSFLMDGESVCTTCYPSPDHPFTTDEWTLLLALTLSKQFSMLSDLSLSENFAGRIKALTASTLA